MSPSLSYFWSKRSSQNKRNTIVPHAMLMLLYCCVSGADSHVICIIQMFHRVFPSSQPKLWGWVSQVFIHSTGTARKVDKAGQEQMVMMHSESFARAAGGGDKDEGWVFMTCDLRTFITMMYSYSIQVHPPKSLQTSLERPVAVNVCLSVSVSGVMNGDVRRLRKFFSR